MFQKYLNIIIKCYRKLDSYQFSLLRIEHVLHFLKSQDGVFNAQKKRSFPAYGSSYWRLILEDWGFVHISFEQCIHGIHLVKKKAQNESHFTIRKLFKEVPFFSHCTYFLLILERSVKFEKIILSFCVMYKHSILAHLTPYYMTLWKII